MSNIADAINVDIHDPRFRIRPVQQMTAACSGAMLTSLFSKFSYIFHFKITSKVRRNLAHSSYANLPFIMVKLLFSVTPLDVIKIRLQTQQKAMLSNKCYIYCNGLMDHLCPCGPGVTPLQGKVRYNGTFVSITYFECL